MGIDLIPTLYSPYNSKNTLFILFYISTGLPFKYEWQVRFVKNVFRPSSIGFVKIIVISKFSYVNFTYIKSFINDGILAPN